MEFWLLALELQYSTNVTLCHSNIIYNVPLSNYARDGMFEGFALFGFNRFGGLPGFGGGSESGGRFLGDFLIGIPSEVE